jgi:hypothetical protein
VAAYQRFLQVACTAGALMLACGGATRETTAQATAGAASEATMSGSARATTMTNAGTAALAGLGGSLPSAGNPTAGAPPMIDATPQCFTYEQLPEAWYENNAAGASGRECPVATETGFGVSYCYFWLSDPVPFSPSPGTEQDCCYWTTRYHCR